MRGPKVVPVLAAVAIVLLLLLVAVVVVVVPIFCTKYCGCFGRAFWVFYQLFGFLQQLIMPVSETLRQVPPTWLIHYLARCAIAAAIYIQLLLVDGNDNDEPNHG